MTNIEENIGNLVDVHIDVAMQGNRDYNSLGRSSIGDTITHHNLISVQVEEGSIETDLRLMIL